ncbi:hypothetical protein Bpfe_016245, partial [Biomphalaria pfeifferi]
MLNVISQVKEKDEVMMNEKCEYHGGRVKELLVLGRKSLVYKPTQDGVPSVVPSRYIASA